jgi:glutathionyl-hydroquinone reductase
MHESTHSLVTSNVLSDPQRFADAIMNALQTDVEIWPPTEYGAYQTALAAALEATDTEARRAFGSLDDAAGNLATVAHARGMALGMAIESFRQDLVRLDVQHLIRLNGSSN